MVTKAANHGNDSCGANNNNNNNGENDNDDVNHDDVVVVVDANETKPKQFLSHDLKKGGKRAQVGSGDGVSE